jgi:hypothetical protein
VICLQETIKATFTYSQLRSYVSGLSYSWKWTAAQGHSGGTLTGVKQGDLDVEEIEKGKYFSSIKIRNKEDNFVWEVINVYGPVKSEKGIFCRRCFRRWKGSQFYLWLVRF